MENIISNKPVFTGTNTGYTKIYASHTPPQDYDYAGKSYWVDGVRTDLPNSENLYVLKEGLEENTTYELELAFYDAMVTNEALNQRFGILVSNKVSLKTKVAPWIKSVDVQNFSVDIGISTPDLLFKLGGDADFIEIEYRVGTGAWEGIYRGAFSETLQFMAPVEGLIELRVRGAVGMGEGSTTDYSPYKVFTTKIQVDKGLNPPAPATNVRFSAAKVSDTFEHIDVLVKWDWEKGSGGLVKSFVLEYLPTSTYNSTGWANARLTPSATATESVITNFPYKVPHTFRVRAVAWGPEDINTTYSANFTFVVDENTVFDSSIVLRTKMEMNYTGLRTYRQDGSQYKQTFGLDASSGSVNIGEVGPDGTSPITVDPLTGTLTVDGKVITESIYSANFILTDFGAASPALYSQGKTYGSANSGIWMGVTGGKYKLDIGNTSQYLRWDGSELKIAGSVRIGTPAGEVSLEDGILNNRDVFIYRVGATQPSRPSGLAYPPTGWSSSVQTAPAGQKLWISSGKLDYAGVQLKEGTVWSPVSQFSGTDGQESFKSTVFTRSSSRPDTPTGASYASPVPSGWSDGVPSGDLQLWASTRVLSVDGKAPQQAAWTIPQAMTNTATLEFQYSSVASSPGTPSSNSSNWSPTATSNTIWLAQRRIVNGVAQGWEVVKVKGEKGAIGEKGATGAKGDKGDTGATGSPGVDGSRGPGIYTQGISSLSSFNTASANSFFQTTFGSGAVRYDVITQYRSQDPSIAFTRMWNGSSWTSPALVVHGDAIVDGTVRAQALVADNAFLAQIGVNTIYNNAAALSGNPEANYTMKISLDQGFIHIR